MSLNQDGPGLGAWNLAAQRVAEYDEKRMAWLDAHKRENGECDYCGAHLGPNNASGCCGASACRNQRKREQHAAWQAGPSGVRCVCGCGRTKTEFVKGSCVCGCGLPLGPQNRSGYANKCRTRNRERMAAHRALHKALSEGARRGWETRRSTEAA